MAAAILARPFQHVLLPANDQHGSPVLVVIAKRTYDIRPGDVCLPALQQLPLFPADRFFNNSDPVTASCEHESDFCPYKPKCDVVLHGTARAPQAVPLRSLLVEVSVGPHQKTIQVFGNRHCQYNEGNPPAWTDPELFVEMPLRYENAYGGVDVYSREDTGALIYPRNPLGKGYAIANTRKVVDGLALPNLEDPANLLTPATLITGDFTGWQKQPLPQSFGWYGKAWFPRCMHAGVMPEHLSLYEQTREVSEGYVAPGQLEAFKRLKLPLMNFQFFNGAHSGMQLQELSGGEPVKLVNMSDSGLIEFPLPDRPPDISIDIGGGPQTPAPIMQTVSMDVDQRRLYVVWRASISYPGPERMHELPALDIEVTE